MKFENFVSKAFQKYKLNGKFSVLKPQILELKNKFLDEFLSYGLPTFRNEDWKYTNLNFLNEIEFDLSTEIDNAEYHPDLTFFNGFPKNLILLQNGRLITQSNNESDFSLGSAFESQDIFAIFEGNNFKVNPLLPLNLALSYDGFLIEIPDNVEIENPFVILFMYENESPSFFNSTNFIKVGKNSKANFVILVNNTSDVEVVTNDLIGIYQHSNSKVEISLFQDEINSLYSFSTIYSKLESDSFFHSNVVSLGPNFVRNNLQIDFVDNNSEALINGIYLAESKQFVDNNTVIRHLKPHCRSNQNYRGILDGTGRAVFNGRIFVDRNAQKTNAYQSNKNILLTNEARINTKPQLEIYADDVKCTHGATAGYLDTEALFYLSSRGISKVIAKALLLNSFLMENIEQIGIGELRDFVKEKIAKKLNLEEIFFCANIESYKDAVK